MKKIFIALLALAAAVSCQSLIEEWQPVTGGPDEPGGFKIYTESELPGFGGTFTSIKDLKAMYKSGGISVSGNVWIKGQVISTDITGNIYRELYIQDNTGGIDVKIGKSSLYGEFALGQWVYVYCDNLQLGAYNDMPQLGLEADNTSTNEYETSYIDVQAIIDQHVFKGAYDTPVAPTVVTEADVKAALTAGYTGELWGKLVTIQNMVYGNEIFALFYPNPNLPHKSANPENRIFLSGNGVWGITTWACSKAKFIEYLQAGVWDTAEVGSGATRYGAGSILKKPSEVLAPGKVLDSFGPDKDITYKEIMIKYATANYVSHYFKVGSTNIQVRTSGYSKFADEELSAAVRGGAPVSITGILTIYNGAAQFSLVDMPSVSVKE